MMPETTFQCPNIKCAYAIASIGLNELQFKVLRRSAKTCPKCNNTARFNEQISLPNIHTNKTTSYGGNGNEALTKKSHQRNQKINRAQERSAHG